MMTQLERPTIDWQYLHALLNQVTETPRCGRVVQVVGLGIEAEGPAARLGEVLTVSAPGREPLITEVVGFRNGRVLLMPLGDMSGIGPGSLVTSTGTPLSVSVGDSLLGRVLDGLGRPIDDGPHLTAYQMRPFECDPPSPLERVPIDEPLRFGIRAVDAFCTIGKGQRIGIFAGSGVGKSTLLGMVAKGSEADVNVICMVGERGREVRDFIERDLGPEGLKRSVVIAATSDQPALIRVRSALVATTIAEYFRDTGRDVLLMMDSITRFATAQREVGLTAGEPPTTKGYPPSVFGILPRLLERAGRTTRGSITGVYTVLVDGDDLMDPVADSLRSILDGHIVLSRALAERNHYPAIDVLGSISRLMSVVASPEHRRQTGALRKLMAAYRDAEDLIQIGAYVSGTDPQVDAAISAMPKIDAFLQQDAAEISEWSQTVDMLSALQATQSEGS